MPPWAPDFRLRRRADFLRVSDHGKGRANNLVVLRYAPNSLPHTRAGFAVSKRVGGAVRRNAVKRRLREAVRKLAPRQSPVDLVLIARPEIAEANYHRIEAAVIDVLSRAGFDPDANPHAPSADHPLTD